MVSYDKKAIHSTIQYCSLKKHTVGTHISFRNALCKCSSIMFYFEYKINYFINKITIIESSSVDLSIKDVEKKQSDLPSTEQVEKMERLMKGD